MLFWKKKSAAGDTHATPRDLDIQSIPDVFYGGQDPLIYHAPAEVAQPEKKAAPVKPESQKPKLEVKAASPHHRGIIIGVIVGLFVLGVGGISWFYLRQAFPGKPAAKKQTASAPAPAKKSETPAPEQPAAPSTTEEVAAPTVTSTANGPTLVFPRFTLQDTANVDADELTDFEEEIFGTDSGAWDTDGDGYYDGQEVFNLYNPKGVAPIRIVDSGLIKEYKNQRFAYRLYYPVAWQPGVVDDSQTQVLFTAATGDYIEVAAMPRTPGESFEEWFAAHADRQKITDLTPFENRFGVELKMRKDNLVAYTEEADQIFVLIFHPSDNGPIRFRRIFQMLVQSFRPSSRVSTPNSPIPGDQIMVTTTPPVATTTAMASTTR